MRGAEPDDEVRDAAELCVIRRGLLSISLPAYFFCATTPLAMNFRCIGYLKALLRDEKCGDKYYWKGRC